MPRSAVVLQHDSIAHLGNLDGTLRSAGFEPLVVDVTTASLDELADAELVVVLGGDVGVYEKADNPFLERELEFLRRRLGERRPTLGVCLGAQLMAEALGETVRAAPIVEIGFRDVLPTPAGLDTPIRHVAGVPMMEWHSDTFDLPSGAVRLASSQNCANEAFSVGDFALAVQFHPELTAGMYGNWITDGAAELVSLGIDPDALRDSAGRLGPAMETASATMFGEWLGTL